jgi:hypothetical protein
MRKDEPNKIEAGDNKCRMDMGDLFQRTAT